MFGFQPLRLAQRGVPLLIALSMIALVPQAGAASDDYPNRPIRVIVPFSAGGGSDVLARLVAQRLGESLKQNVIVENRPGAGGSLGTMEVAKAAADGYTLLLGTSSTHGINPAIYSSLKYDVQKDFVPLAVLAGSEYALVVAADSPYRSIDDLVRASATTPIKYASSGNGTTSHLASALLTTSTGAAFIHVPYKTSTSGMIDTIGGQTDFMVDNTSVALPQAQSGKVRILATTGRTRGASTPTIPTMIESGVKDYEIIGWWAVFAPSATPKPIADRLRGEIERIIGQPDYKQKMVAMGNEPFVQTAADDRAFIADELKHFKTIVDTAGAKLD